MEDVAEERKWRESMGRRAERIMRGFGIEEDEADALNEGMFLVLFSGIFGLSVE